MNILQLISDKSTNNKLKSLQYLILLHFNYIFLALNFILWDGATGQNYTTVFGYNVSAYHSSINFYEKIWAVNHFSSGTHGISIGMIKNNVK